MKKIFSFLFLFSVIVLPAGFAADEPNLITAVSDVAQKTGPAVVAIKTEKTEHYRTQFGGLGNPGDDDIMDQFFSDFFGVPPEYQQKMMGLGSGVIIDSRGYILTNDHVVHGADKITVTLPDGRKFDGELTGVDIRSDLAVVKITAPNLPVASIGNAESLKIGQWVVAIGNPFGNILDDSQPTVTSGVISALHRSLPQTSRRDSDYSDLIQTDAAINPGNSGGPLVNLNGEVIGINVAIFSTSGGYQGLGFAIPINYAKAIVDQLIEGKKIQYGWIGVSIQDINERLAQYFNLSESEGVLVLKVLDGSPADKAGLKEGDIILSVNKIKVRNTSALVKQISNAQIGKPVNLQIVRDQKNMDMAVMIGQNPGALPADIPKPMEPKPVKLNKPWRGLIVRELNNETAQKLMLANTNGVLIENIEPASPAQMSGLQTNDVIIAINKKPVRTMQDYIQAVSVANGAALVRTVRGFFVVEQ